MDRNIINKQESLAEQLLIDDIIIGHISHEAVLKIKRWKFIIKIPGIHEHIRKEAGKSIQISFLNYITNKFLLKEEGYFFLRVKTSIICLLVLYGLRLKFYLFYGIGNIFCFNSYFPEHPKRRWIKSTEV